MIKDFKAGEDNLMFAVMGGSLSEGIDYSGNVIKGIIIVGIPLEKPNLELRAKVDYLDKKFGMRGNEYAYLIPGVVKAVQAAGRAIRSETDRAFILFMDVRYSWNMYKSIISDFMQIDEGSNYLPTIRDFMASGKRQFKADNPS
jgi:DNA excision repair protein ERCC-2